MERALGAVRDVDRRRITGVGSDADGRDWHRTVSARTSLSCAAPGVVYPRCAPRRLVPRPSPPPSSSAGPGALTERLWIWSFGGVDVGACASSSPSSYSSLFCSKP
jgi:hypothetical protein